VTRGSPQINQRGFTSGQLVPEKNVKMRKEWMSGNRPQGRAEFSVRGLEKKGQPAAARDR
jgi:hypothetical protein